jgi:NAD(P)-dependent dehydrogenase (short-subunit alcohol dehydrogenase family)
MATVLVTGANRGIGLEYCRQLSVRGDDVIAVCREASPELESLGIRIEAGIELTDSSAIDELMSRLRHQSLDGAIFNAGILHSTGINDLDPDAIRQQFEVNALAPLRLASVLTRHLSSGSWIALMTSRMGSIADNTSGGSYGYRMSKAALNMAGRSLAVDLKPKGIAVAILHPGLVATRMINFNPNGISPQQSVDGLLKRIDALTLETSGSFWHANGEELPW